MNSINSAVRCWEQLCEPAFFKRVASMAGYSCGANPSVSLTYRYHGQDEKRRVESLLRRGLSTSQTAQQTGIPIGTVSKWRQALVQGGKLQPMRIT